jgi:hypothetical protein
MGFDDSAEDIRRRMEQLRRELSCDAREVSRSARVLNVWRFYVRRFPCATVALTAAGGYLLFPK